MRKTTEDEFERVQREMKAELDRTTSANAWLATAAMIYVCIDAMACAAMPAGQAENTKSDFITWVDAYMSPHSPDRSEYRYSGADLYQARCSLVHTLSAESAKTPKLFGYFDDGLPHRQRPDIDKHVVLLNVTQLKDDFFAAVARFIAAAKAGKDGGALVASRFARIYGIKKLNQ